MLDAGSKWISSRKTGGRKFFVRGHGEDGGVSSRRHATREREQTIVQIAPYFMITHVQTALRKAGNYDKTGRARKNMRTARFSCTLMKGEGGKRWDTWLLGHHNSRMTLRSNWLSLIVACDKASINCRECLGNSHLPRWDAAINIIWHFSFWFVQFKIQNSFIC